MSRYFYHNQNCQWCGERFSSNRYDAQYCSAKCRMAVKRQSEAGERALLEAQRNQRTMRQTPTRASSARTVVAFNDLMSSYGNHANVPEWKLEEAKQATVALTDEQCIAMALKLGYLWDGSMWEKREPEYEPGLAQKPYMSLKKADLQTE